MSEIIKKRGRPRRPQDPRTPAERRADWARQRRDRAIAAAAEAEKLPDDTRIRQPLVEVLLSYSATTVWRRVKDGKLPEPHRDGRITTWRLGDIRRMLADAGEVPQ